MGTARDRLSPSLRMFTVGNYVLYFRPAANTVRIERVVHASRDVDALFE